MAGWLENDVALITGGGSGLGLALVRRFLNEGAKVAVLEVSQGKADAVRREFGDAVVVTIGDVRSLDDNDAAVSAAVARFGKLDVFVGNAGIVDNLSPLAETPAERLSDTFDEVMGINVKGYILGARAAMGELKKSRGAMVFTASTAAFIPGGAGIFYTASKHAVVGVVRELAYQLAPYVRVNGVGPGPMRTDLRGSSASQLNESVFAPNDDEAFQALAKLFPLARFEPEDYTGIFVALASRANSSTTTGEVINAGNGLGIRGTMTLSGGIAN